ncbi:MAG: hypothetical protein JWP81_4881 [Ferruginibacter sp.]|nr:hypothetical protein [Ferruginibacter sp.]
MDKWKLTVARANFPMVLDAANHRLFIGCRHPSKLLVLNLDTGQLIADLDTDSDVDDIFYDPKSSNIYLSCGGGYVDFFVQQDTNSYKFIEQIRTCVGRE